MSPQSAMLPAGPPGSGEQVPPVSGPDRLLLHELFPHLRGLPVDRVEGTGQAVVIWACPAAAGVACPRCGTWSSRVHSWSRFGGFAGTSLAAIRGNCWPESREVPPPAAERGGYVRARCVAAGSGLLLVVRVATRSGTYWSARRGRAIPLRSRTSGIRCTTR